jgi:hypothetical protein
MSRILTNTLRASFAAGLTLFAATGLFAQDDSVGIVRITKLKSPTESVTNVTPAGFRHSVHHQGASGNCDCQQGSCPQRGLGLLGGHCNHGPWACQHGCSDNGKAMTNYFRCKFGYFVPTGAGGAGLPWVGKYSRVYPNDPYYFDQRDGNVWAAQGYGAPMAVPLAPTVGHTYNYGWGIPSSRLTPISRPAY